MIQAIKSTPELPPILEQKKSNYTTFEAKQKNSLERSPKGDKFNKDSNTGKKIGLGVLGAAAVAIIIDYAANKGRASKSLMEKVSNIFKKTNKAPKEIKFEIDGNKFVLTKGKLTSYKNSAGEELIGKYKNPVTDADKDFKKIIDAKIKELLSNPNK